MLQQDLVILNGTIHTPSESIQGGYLLVTSGRIQAIGEGKPQHIPGSAMCLDVNGKLVLPGFIDIHVNGGGGSLAMDGTVNAIQAMAEAHAKFGTTAILPTTISADDGILARAVSAIAEVANQSYGGASILGVHLEGPFLNPVKAGAHRREFLKLPSVEYFDKLYKMAKGRLRIIALAPELDGAIQLITHAQQRHVIVSLAHSDADYTKTREAIDAGMQLCAHLFNAMPPLTHRAPGPIGAFLTSKHTFVELIADGFHVHPAVMEVVIRSKGPEKVILVTDAVTPAGTSMTTFHIFGTQLEVKGNSCFAPDGNLAGSALTMNKAVKTIVDSTHTTLTDALKMASLNPARLLGIDKMKGTLEVGKDADIVIADDDLSIHATIVGGAIVHQR